MKKHVKTARAKSSFADFVMQPWIAASFLIIALVTLILSLNEFASARGF
jgi:hypothetical protein